jgi:hypothetical protein
MHFINLLGENDSEVVILTYETKSLLIDITLLRLPILRLAVVILVTSSQLSYQNPEMTVRYISGS